MRRFDRPANRIVLVVGLLIGLVGQLIPAGASATPGFQSAMVRLDRMATSTATGGTVCAKPTTASTEAKVIVKFPSTTSPFTLSTTLSDWTIDTTHPNNFWPTGAVAWLGMVAGVTGATAVDNVAKTVTWTSGDLVVGTLYCFNFPATGITSTGSTAAPSLQGYIKTQTGGSADIDYTPIALALAASDQILVTAVVPPTFQFDLDGTTDAFGTSLDYTTINASGGRTVTVTTNAKGGWIAWAKDLNQGLHSATASKTIATKGTIDATTSLVTANTEEAYVLDVEKAPSGTSACTLGVDPEYDGDGSHGGTFAANFQPIGACTGGTSDHDVLSLQELVVIKGTTPAATDYADTITVVGAGNF